jgi:methenyltetrahydrofolate cyclohydrolase
MSTDLTNVAGEPDSTVAAYAAALASDAPAPGGGSAAAVTATLAVALGEKVCRFTIGKPAFAEFEAEITRTLARLGQARARLLRLAADDETAFEGYARASALPKATDEERTARKSAMTSALQDAAMVPLEVAKETTDFLAALESVARHGNRNLISDVSVAGYLAEAAISASSSLVQSNTAYLRTKDAAEMSSLALRLEQEGRALNKTIQEIVDRDE